jgi:hypothetical protein
VLENLIRELHNGGLSGHFAIDKTRALVEVHYYWPRMAKDVKKWVECCQVCQRAKRKVQNTKMYTPLLIPKTPSKDININFTLGLPRTQ